MYYEDRILEPVPFADVITFLFFIYVAAYVIGFSVGGSRYFKWIASIAAGVFFVSFGMAAGESQIGGGFVRFLIAIPLLGWSIPFALGGGLRRLVDSFLPRTGQAGRILVAVVGLIGPLALVFTKPARLAIERQERAEQARLAIEACGRRGISGTFGGFDVHIPISPQMVLGADGGVRGDDEAYSLGWSFGWQGLCRRDAKNLSITFLSVHRDPTNDAKQRWFREECSLNGGSKDAPLCVLYSHSVKRVFFSAVPLRIDVGRKLSKLRQSDANKQSSQEISENGITVVSKDDKGRIVARLDGAEGWDDKPVLLVCWPNGGSMHCSLDEQITPTIVRTVELQTSERNAATDFARARLASDRLFAEITSVKSTP